MKKFYKRFLALVMAMAMSFNCTSVASASEDVAVDSAAVCITDDNGVMPLESVRVNGGYAAFEMVQIS